MNLLLSKSIRKYSMPYIRKMEPELVQFVTLNQNDDRWIDVDTIKIPTYMYINILNKTPFIKNIYVAEIVLYHHQNMAPLSLPLLSICHILNLFSVVCTMSHWVTKLSNQQTEYSAAHRNLESVVYEFRVVDGRLHTIWH